MKENKYNINKSKFKKLQWQVQSGTQPVCAWDHAFEHAAFCVLKEHFLPFTLSNTFAVLQVEWTKGIFALQTVMCVQTIQTACWTVFTAPARLVPMSLMWTNGHTQLAVGEKHTCVDIQTCIKIPALNIWQRSSFCTCIWEICRLEASPSWQESHWSFRCPEHVLQEESHCSHSIWPAHTNTKSVNEESDSF